MSLLFYFTGVPPCPAIRFRESAVAASAEVQACEGGCGEEDLMKVNMPNKPNRNYWIGVVSRSHVQVGVKGGFIQLIHGKKAPLQKFHAGDGLIMYSPRTSYPDGEVLQAFTAIGTVISGEIYLVEMTPDFKPYRVDIKYLNCRETPIKPLIDKLTFIKNKTHWGAAFRFGQVKIPEKDFKLIAGAMDCKVFNTEKS